MRKRLAGLAADARVRGGYESGLYSAEHSMRIYGAMLAEAAEHLRAGHGVILDATFQRRADRDAVRTVASEQRVPVLLVECRCGDDEVRRRLAARSGGAGPSDADWDVYLEQRRRYEMIAGDERTDGVTQLA